MTSRRLLWFAPLLLVACSVDRGAESLGTARSRIVAGTKDTHDPSVVMVLQKSSPTASDIAIICTGSIVSPHVVLTAAHCLDPKVVGAGVFGVFVGNDVDDASQWNDATRKVDAVATHIHPKWVATTVNTSHDVGVLVTGDALSGAPLPMNFDAVGDDFVGTAIRAVGTGQTSASDSNSSGHTFELASKVASIEPDHLVFEEASKSLCHGDSGGPTFATLGNRELIVGVHSGTTQTCTGENVDTRLDVYAEDFVVPFIKDADPGFDPGGPTTSADAGASSPTGPGSKEAPDGGEAESTTSPASDGTSTSGCVVSPRASSNMGLLLATVAMVAALARRRRAR